MSISKANGLLRNKWVLIAGVAIIAGLVAWLAYNYIDTRNQLARLSDPKAVAQIQSEELVKTVGQYIQLPNEAPTVATVKDAQKLKEQEFFKNAEDGDKVLIFSESGRALLYRPSTKKIIEYSKVDLAGTQP